MNLSSLISQPPTNGDKQCWTSSRIRPTRFSYPSASVAAYGLSMMSSRPRSGADKIAMNTAAVKDPQFITRAAEAVGSQCVVLAIDCRRNTDVERGQYIVTLEDGTQAWYEVVIYGGRTPTGIDAIEWAMRSERLGAGEIMLTSMNRDGTKDGYDIPITKAISEAIDLPIIASGGAGTAEHIYAGFVDGKADACLAASIFHFKEISIASLKQYLQARGIPIRM